MGRNSNALSACAALLSLRIARRQVVNALIRLYLWVRCHAQLLRKPARFLETPSVCLCWRNMYRKGSPTLGCGGRVSKHEVHC